MNWLLEFLFPRRLHRLAYFIRGLMTDLVMVMFYAIGNTMDSCTIITGLITLAAYQAFFILIPRLRDIDMSSWWVLLFFVPVANVVLGLILLFRAPSFQEPPPREITPVVY
jgi:uncharacterized membrane protein YhaH (DUF805 family)